MTYAQKLKSPKWQKRRLEILNRDNFSCQYCGDNTTTLHIHHSKYTGEPWEAPDDDLKTLCEDCHYLIDVDVLADADAHKLKQQWGLFYFFIMPNDKGVVIYSKNNDDKELKREGMYDMAALKFLFELFKDKL